MPRALAFLSAAALAAGLAAPPGAAAQPPPPASLEARVQELEARMAAIEARTAPPAGAAATGPACRRLNVNGSRIPPGGTLTAAVNGTVVGTWDEAAYGDLEPFMRPGPNSIALAFAAAPPGNTADAELRCLPPGSASSRTVVLRLRPAPGRLRAETVVVLP